MIAPLRPPALTPHDVVHHDLAERPAQRHLTHPGQSPAWLRLARQDPAASEPEPAP